MADKVLQNQDAQPDEKGKKSLSRRGFIGWLVSLSITTKLAAVLTACVGGPQETGKPLTSPAAFTRVGALSDFPLKTGKRVTVNDRPVMIANTQEGGLTAISAICTHEGCIVGWNNVGGYMECPCHQGSYSPKNGRVLSGPPPRPLAKYEIEVRGDEVFVGRPLGAL